MRRRALPRLLPSAALALAAALAVAPGALGATSQPTGWDGTNPFVCELQQAGFNATGPHPEVDPYCVEFDKRRQNVLTDHGVVDFLLLEPGRVAAASDKCFYFQSDHWRGSLVQDDPNTKTYEWDGHYFFNKATGDGGIWVTNFNFNGQTQDPGALPGMPPEYGRFFGPGTGGFISHNQVPTDPRCVALAAAHPEYFGTSASAHQGCFRPGGAVARGRLGPVSVGMSERQVRGVLGDPGRIQRGFLRYCLTDGTRFLVGVTGDRSGEFGPASDEPTAILLSDSRAFRFRGAGVGTREKTLRRRWRRATRRVTLGGLRVYELSGKTGIVAGVERGAVRWIGVFGLRWIRSRSTLAGYVSRAPE